MRVRFVAVLVVAALLAPGQSNAAEISALVKLLDRYPARAKLSPRAEAAVRDLRNQLGEHARDTAFDAAACQFTHRGTFAYEHFHCSAFDDFTRNPGFDPNRPLVGGTPVPFFLRPGFRFRVVGTPPPGVR
jgi:hypothetical protein